MYHGGAFMAKMENQKQITEADGRGALLLKLPMPGKKGVVPGIAQREAIAAANKLGARLFTEWEFRKREVLADIDLGKELLPLAWTGTFVAYKAPGEKFGEEMAVIDPRKGKAYLFKIPQEFQDEKNAILVAEHGFQADGRPTIQMHQHGRNAFAFEIADAGITLLPDFPTARGCYMADEKFGVPLGAQVERDAPGAIFLPRDREYFGLVSYSDAIFQSGGQLFARHFGIGWKISTQLVAFAEKIMPDVIR